MAGVRSTCLCGVRLLRDFGPRRAAAMTCSNVWRRLRHRRPPNTVQGNLEVWSTHDWSRLGEEWTPSAEWTEAVLAALMAPYVPPGASVLEIGPGAGRWTRHLLRRAGHVILVDLTPACIALCRQRFGDGPGIDYHVNDGRDLSFAANGAIDCIWSFDVFVHIAPDDIEHYVSQFPAILTPGGHAVIHHARDGASKRSWRSDMTAEKMREIAERCCLDVVAQVDELAGGPVNGLGSRNPQARDVVTILRRP